MKQVFESPFKDLTLEEVFEAYFECRKTKRYSSGAIQFETDYENQLVKLYNELKESCWKPGKSTCFTVTKPVRREIFAAPFRDRIVHHVLIRRLNPFFERYFIFDSYACRKQKGTHAAIKRLEHFIKSESKNGKEECYVLKLDIKGFFMNINRNLLWKRLENFIDNIEFEFSFENPPQKKNVDFVKYLCRQIIFNDCTKDCIIRSPKSEWKKLPKDKSLFTAKKHCGLPIGNLTSQVFANFYLSELDHFIKHNLKIKNYVRYVDDFAIVHKDKQFLKKIIPTIRRFLSEKLYLTLHPHKVYLQKVQKGVHLTGCFILPSHTVCNRRIKNNFARTLKKISCLAQRRKPSKNELKKARSSINSYLGILQHYRTYRFRTNQIKKYMLPHLKKHFSVSAECKKIGKLRSVPDSC